MRSHLADAVWGILPTAARRAVAGAAATTGIRDDVLVLMFLNALLLLVVVARADIVRFCVWSRCSGATLTATGV